MITVIHGDDIESSREYFYSLKQDTKNYTQIDGENLLFSDFFQQIEADRLFDDKPALFIENFLSKNKLTEEFKKIIDYINNKKILNIVFWESSELTKSQQANFKSVVFKIFSYPKSIFLFLDNLKPGNSRFLISQYKDLRKSTNDEIIFFMIIRQFRLMISLLNNSDKNIDESNRLASWQISKLKKQIGYFDKDGIIKTYLKLFETDLNTKTGKLGVSYEKSIDFLLASL